jgi:hypothetical protein
MMEAVQTSETSVNSYQSTRRYNPEDSHLRSLPCLQKPATGPYSEQDEISLHPYIFFHKIGFSILPSMARSLSGLFPSGFLTLGSVT